MPHGHERPDERAVVLIADEPTTVLAFNLLGDGLRDALDPKLNG